MRLLLVIPMLWLLSGCSAIDMKRYSTNTPQLDLFEYFSGTTKGWGIVQDRKGTLTRQFIVDIRGEVNSNGELVLQEDFAWSDGEQSERTWVLSKQDEHNFNGTAEDVNGLAEGTLYGNVLNWKYQLNITVEGTNWKINLDDWMFQVSEDMVINRAAMSKFGYRVGDITIVFRK